MTGRVELKDHDAFGVLYLGAAAITALATLVFTPLKTLTLNAVEIWILVYLGIFASGICFFLWNLGARQVDAGALAIFNDMKIPLAVAISLLVFGEKTNLLNLIIGGAIVVVSLIFNEVYQRRHPEKMELAK
jgi:drug/metabolite transporter (DMT)-like permease